VTEDLREPVRAIGDQRARWKRAAMVGVLLALVAFSAAYVYGLLFVTFRRPDDEGYFLLALRAYGAGATLYDQIDTIYGPFYFEFVGGLSKLLGVPVDHVTARWFMLVVLILSCLGIFRYVQRVTRSSLAALLAYFLTFPILSHLASSPPHPSALIALLLSALILATLGLSKLPKRSTTLAVCGALTSAIALSKLNAGAFVLIAFAALYGRFAPRTRSGMVLRIALFLFLAALPFVLMAPQLGREDMLLFAWTVSLSLAPFGFLALLDSEEHSPLPFTPYIAGGLALTAIVLAICLYLGSRWIGLWRSLVLGTVNFPGSFVLAPHFEPGMEIVLALAAIPIVLGARARGLSRIRSELRTLLKLAGGLTILALCFGTVLNSLRALPLVWLVAVPRTTSQRGVEMRTALALLAVLLSLHAYPVGGHQAALSAWFFPAVGVIIVWDAFEDLPRSWRAVLLRRPWKLLGASATLALLALFHSLRANIPVLASQFQKTVPLELPGAESVRVEERFAAELAWVTANLRQHGDTFVGIPGLHSFYFWSGLVPPVPFYPSTWILYLDEVQKAELARALLASQRPCVLRDRAMVKFWTVGRKLEEGPLVQSADRDFKLAGAVGDYELLIPLASRPDLLLSILPEPASSELRNRFETDRVLRLTFPVMHGVHVARLVVRPTRRGAASFDTAVEGGENHVTVVDARGRDLLHGPSEFIDLSTRSDIFMIPPAPGAALGGEDMLIRAYDESGNIVARLLVPNGFWTP
jgi:hypothetical protein